MEGIYDYGSRYYPRREPDFVDICLGWLGLFTMAYMPFLIVIPSLLGRESISCPEIIRPAPISQRSLNGMVAPSFEDFVAGRNIPKE